MEMLVVLGLFVVLAVLGPVIGADSPVPGGWNTHRTRRQDLARPAARTRSPV